MIYENEIRPNVKGPVVSTKGAHINIGEAEYPKPFYIGLEYSSPARGHWTIAHSPMLIPQCHEIYVCCACCLHGVVLSADEVPQGAERFSMVTLTNENIIKGNLEEMMIDGISHIIDTLAERPKCVEGFTSCMQHFMHMDIPLVYNTLRSKYPDIDFIDGYMTPTLQRQFSPDVLGRRQLMRAVQKRPQKKAINFIVNYYPVDTDSEMVKMFHDGGYTTQDFANCKTYEDYKKLGEAEANIYFLSNSGPAAKDMERRLDQQALYLQYSYDYAVIRKNLEMAAEQFKLAIPDCDAYEAKIEEKLSQLKKEVGHTHIAIDFDATPRPLSLARLLLDHGFNVYAVYLNNILPEEEENFYYLKEHYPTLSLRTTKHYKCRIIPRDDAQKYGKVLAIGQLATYFTNTTYFVNLIENSGLYGYVGIMKLIDLISEANKEEKNVRSIIQVKAWGCVG